jgi:tRNA-splicing ligase RtcB
VTCEEGSKPIKQWTDGVPVEEKAAEQLRQTAALPFIYKHIAVMPDVHWGFGSTVGSVVPTLGAIVPAAVGVDIGCGMIAQRTTLTAGQLPDSLSLVRSNIEAAVPHGRTDNGGINDRGSWSDLPEVGMAAWGGMHAGLGAIEEHHPKIRGRHNAAPERHLGTLGTGNHFIEVCLDESDRVWVMLHSGSRGIGNRIGNYFISKAKEETERWHSDIPNSDLAFLPEGHPLFDDYMAAVDWAQDYARVNRDLMLAAVLGALHESGLPEFSVDAETVNCHHNYVAREHHFGKNIWVTRKGAVRAREGDLGIIPGSMGVQSYIVRGKGNPESFHSCSHGAGRRMSRGAAKKTFTLEDHAKATEGVECRKDEGVLDETPGAYKDIDAVMAAQSDLVEIVHTLRQVVCVKG